MPSYEEVIAALQRGPGAERRVGGRPIVLFQAPWKRSDDGWCIAVRAYARAMALGGIDVRLQDWLEPEKPPEVDVPAAMRKWPADWDQQVFSCGLSGFERMQPVLESLLSAKRPRSFYAVFERRHIEPELIAQLQQLDSVWVQCEMNQQVLEAAGLTNVTLIPFPFFEDDPHLEIGPPLRSRTTKFYWIGRNEPRKAPDNLIRAFLRAFKPGEATLTMKLSKYGHPLGFVTELEDVIWSECGSRSVDSIRIIKGRISEREMLRLHAGHDVYVASSRGEGLDLPCFQAKLSGRKVVTTASGGPEDFMDPDFDIVVPATGLVDAEEHYFTWGKGATYIDYDVDALAAAMQQAAASPRGKRQWPGMEQFKGAAVGKRLKWWIGT